MTQKYTLFHVKFIWKMLDNTYMEYVQAVGCSMVYELSWCCFLVQYDRSFSVPGGRTHPGKSSLCIVY